MPQRGGHRPGQTGGVKVRTVRVSRQLKQHQAEVFTEDQESAPGEWFDFASSRVARARYDYGLRQVQVVFNNGNCWVYEQVPPEVFRRFRISASAGKFINRVLNGYPYRSAQGEFV